LTHYTGHAWNLNSADFDPLGFGRKIEDIVNLRQLLVESFHRTDNEMVDVVGM